MRVVVGVAFVSARVPHAPVAVWGLAALPDERRRDGPYWSTCAPWPGLHGGRDRIDIRGAEAVAVEPQVLT